MTRPTLVRSLGRRHPDHRHVLPQTGNAGLPRPARVRRRRPGVQEINEAGGVLGKDVVHIDGDSGDTSTNIASQTVDRLLSEGVDAIIGAASSGCR
jgi:hypothetical protein